jgi:hypothetical protein
MLRQPLWIDKFEKMEVYSFPFRLGNLLSILFFTLIFSYLIGAARTFGAASMLYSIMLSYVSLVLFFGSLFIITDFSTLGYQEIPNVSPNVLKSERGRFTKVFIIICAILSQFLLIESLSLKVVYLSLCLILLPLAISVLILESKLLSALNPLKWAAVLMGVKFDSYVMQYFILQISSLFVGYVALFLDYGFYNLISMAAFLAVLTALFRSLGVVIHSNANALGLKVQYSKEIEDAQKIRANGKGTSDFCDSIYLQWTSGQQKMAWERLQEKILEDNYDCDADMFDRISRWADPALAVRFGQTYLERLVKQGSIDTAWSVLEFCFEKNNKEYKILTAATLVALSKAADSFERKSIIVSILRYFEEDFPHHPETAQILLYAAKIAADDLDDFKKAKIFMRILRRNYPAIYSDATYLALRKILNT